MLNRYQRLKESKNKWYIYVFCSEMCTKISEVLSYAALFYFPLANVLWVIRVHCHKDAEQLKKIVFLQMSNLGWTDYGAWHVTKPMSIFVCLSLLGRTITCSNTFSGYKKKGSHSHRKGFQRSFTMAMNKSRQVEQV